MDILFDNLKDGILNNKREDDGQLSLVGYDEDINLPNLELKDRQIKKKSKTTKQISLDDIKTIKPKRKNKSNGLGIITLSDSINTKSDVINNVAKKYKENLDNRNKELMHVREHPYIRSSFILTEAEKKLYRFIRHRIANNLIILSKVRLADVVNVNEAVSRDYKAFRDIALKHVDFIILNPNFELICVVELDDYTHETDKAKERDTFVGNILRECNVPLYRIGVRIDNITKEDTKAMEFCILDYMSPTCKECGRPMEPKESKYKRNYGHRFYGCMGFYESGDNKCSYTIDID